MEEANVNISTCKRFLKTSGLHVSNEAAIEMQSIIKTYAEQVAKAAGQKATEKGRKTIFKEDMQLLTNLTN